MIDVDRRLEELGPRGWTLLVATVLGLLGAVVAVTILALFFGDNLLVGSSSSWSTGWPYVVSAWFTGTLVGALAWLTLVEKPTNASDLRGLAAGAIAMLATHVLMFVMPVGWGIATGWSRPALSSLPGADPIGVYTQVTLFLFGPITLPVAAFLGRALARRRRRQIGAGGPLDVRERMNDLSPRGWTLFAATVFGIGAMLTAVLISLLFGALLSGIVFGTITGVGGFVVGGILWGILVELRRTVSDRTGALVGALTVLLTHFVIPLFSAYGVFGPPPASFSTNANLFDHVIASATPTLTIGGMITIPVGAYIGWRLAVTRQPTIAGSDTTAVDDVSTE